MSKTLTMHVNHLCETSYKLFVDGINLVPKEEINNLKKHIYEIEQSNVSYQKQITQLENSLQNLNESYQNEISDYQQKIQELEDQLNSNKRKINRKQKSRITKDENSD